MSEVQFTEEATNSSSYHYLELFQVPMTFETIDQVESAFFDQSNFQMFCVQSDYTDVTMSDLSQVVKMTIPSRGPVSAIKFSGGKARILSIQRQKLRVEFVNIFSENRMECSLPNKGRRGPNIIGFYWIFEDQFVVLISTNGIEVYSCSTQKMSFKLAKSYSMSLSWAVFSPEDLLLLVCAKDSNILHPFIFKEGAPNAIMRLPKFEVEMGLVMERDVVIMRLYGQHYVGVIRNTLLPGQGTEVLLYQILNDSNPARLAHILIIDISGRFTLSVVDDLVIVLHQAWKTSLVFDIMFNEKDSSGQVKKHQAVLAPLAIAPAKLQVHHKGGKAKALSPSGSITSSLSTNLPELYSPKWIVFQPDLIVDAQYGVIWRLALSLESTCNMMPDKSMLIQFLLMRKMGKGFILSVCRDCLEPGRQLSLSILGSMFDQVNMAYRKSTLTPDQVDKKYKVVISQRDMYARVFAPFSERKDMSYRFLIAALMEYLRSLHRSEVAIEGFLLEYLMSMLVENQCLLEFYHIGDDTLLHTASKIGSEGCIRALLQLDPPIMLRNAAGKTARDVATSNVQQLFDAYITENQAKIYLHYDEILLCAKKRYSNAERITRIFVIGNCGAGKSTFVEAMKREGFFASFSKVSESSVAPHTAGIVPSVYTSKLYGRVLFYDFAGDPEYYSSHAAILENLASSTKGDNIFILVVDLREDLPKIRNIIDYWVFFINHQKFMSGKKNLIIIGSHSDLMTKDEKKVEVKKFCEKNAQSLWHCEIAYFTLNCCEPKSKPLQEIKGRIIDLTKDSPRYELSIEAGLLLGLLEKDFSNVTACSAQTIVSHIKDTGVSLLRNIASLMPILEELHDLGLLFKIGKLEGENIPQVILNISQLTNEVHKLLFSKEAKKKFAEGENSISSLNVGILPQSVLDSLLPQYITKECLVKLQYCQEISQHETCAFPSLTQPASSDQSYLFFPALCTASKDDVSWLTPPSLSYSIGWLARCSDTSCNYFPPRFLHVLLLRLVFSFTLAVPAQHTSASPDHSHLKRRCTMWNCGVHWSMEEGVECMVELVNGNKGIVVITHSEEDAKVNCINVFRRVISCVMEAKAKFCHSIRPQFFLLNPSQSADYLHEDNLFAMSDVERVLASREGILVLSVTGKAKLKREEITCLCKFTLWNSLFSLDFRSVVHYLEDVVHDLYKLFLYLGLPKSYLDTIEANFPNNVDRRRAELVGVWISSSSPDPQCWWQLVQALKVIKHGRLAQDIETRHSECMQ